MAAIVTGMQIFTICQLDVRIPYFRPTKFEKFMKLIQTLVLSILVLGLAAQKKTGKSPAPAASAPASKACTTPCNVVVPGMQLMR